MKKTVFLSVVAASALLISLSVNADAQGRGGKGQTLRDGSCTTQTPSGSQSTLGTGLNSLLMQGYGDGTGTQPLDGTGLGPGDGTRPQPKDGTGFGKGAAK
ncbi:MAG: hypothetical protein HGA78_04555 [Nitrospirales bacterium]|nr:hypothetical protein [Nitrospirales bacterium]